MSLRVASGVAQAVPPALTGSGPRNAPPPVPEGANSSEMWWRSDAGPLVMDGYYHDGGDSKDAVVSRDPLSSSPSPPPLHSPFFSLILC
jgi:hypothetical protein